MMKYFKPRVLSSVLLVSMISWNQMDVNAAINISSNVMQSESSSGKISNVDVNELYQSARNESKNGDAVKAFEMFKQIYDLGDVRGAEQIASAYENGIGIEQNYEKALEWYTIAVEMGSGYACTQLGILYRDGKGVEQNYEKAIAFFEQATVNDPTERKGPRYAGDMYENGIGTNLDLKKAAYYYDIAASRGDITGATAIARMYEDGRGVTKDYKKAVSYYKLAAEQDNNQAAEAMYALGRMYEAGIGVNKDFETAISWYQVAAEHKSSEAEKALSRLNIAVRSAETPKGDNGKPIETVISDYPDAAKKFKQYTYEDAETGCTIPYNLYLPDSYYENTETVYPIVIFIADASVNSDDVTNVLKENGAVVWASDQEQKKHECIVLAPQYTRFLKDSIGSLTTDAHEWSTGLTLVSNLINHVITDYRVDQSRIYGTGQSQGGMTTIALSIKYPELYTAQILVASQWDVQEMYSMKDDKLWIVTCEGDRKAYPAMTEAVNLWKEAGAKVATSGIWDSLYPKEQIEKMAASMKSQDGEIHLTVLKDGDHNYTWSVAYQIEGIRDWLFEQSK